MSQYSVVKEIKRAEDNIQQLHQKVTDLESKLKTKALPAEQKKNLEQELKDIRKLITTSEDHLSKLHGENRRSFAVAAALFFLIFLFYGLYVLLKGQEL